LIVEYHIFILTCLMFMQQNGGYTMAQAHQILGNWQQGF